MREVIVGGCFVRRCFLCRCASKLFLDRERLRLGLEGGGTEVGILCRMSYLQTNVFLQLLGFNKAIAG